MGDTVPDINTDAKSESDSNLEETGEVEAALQEVQEVGELACPKCEQIYAGPASLKRHLWRIHRLAGDDAQALVDEAEEKPIATEETEEKPSPNEDEVEDEEAPSTTTSSEVKPLLAVSLSTTTTPKVRPLLSLSPEPPIFQGAYSGGMSPGTPWSMHGQGGSGAALPQTGLLPTPPAGPGIGSACHQPSSPEVSSKSNGNSPEPASSNKVPPLMSLGIAPSPDQGGIKPLMSIPVDFPPYMMSSPMGMGYYGARFRRRERRPRPYPQKEGMREEEQQDSKQDYDNNSENGNQADLSTATEEESYDSGERDQSEIYDTICGECGIRFEDPASLADHEPCSQSVSIDLNCDVEITG